MKQDADTSAEHTMQWQLLTTEIGIPGSGAIRYAAAMHFYGRGLLSHELLEIYRICSKFDHEDPISVAHFENVAATLSQIQQCERQ